MAAYSYKSVCHRSDFIAAVQEYCTQNNIAEDDLTPSADYDGDYWYVAAFLLDQKDVRIEELEERVFLLEKA